MLKKLVFLQFVLVSLLSIPGRVFAQQEQWLGYKTHDHSYNYIGVTYGSSLNLTDKAPEGVKLPEIKDDKPLFAEGQSPVSKQPVYFLLTRSRKNGLYDRLYADTNFDGSLADEKPVKAYDIMNSGDYKRTEFKNVEFVLPGEDGPISYNLHLSCQGHGNNLQLYLQPGCWYEGWVHIGGRKYWCVVIDNNADGKFGEVSKEKQHCDRIRISETHKFIPRSESDNTVFLGKYVDVDGKWYCVEIAPDGAYVKFNPAQDIQMGTLECDKLINSINLAGESGNFIKKPVDGKIEVPAGEYSVDNFKIERKDDNGAKWVLDGAYRNKSLMIEAGKTASLGAVEPLIAKVSSRQNGKDYYLSLDLTTSDGGTFTFTRDGVQPSAPKMNIRNADGSYDKTRSLEYG